MTPNRNLMALNGRIRPTLPRYENEHYLNSWKKITRAQGVAPNKLLFDFLECTSRSGAVKAAGLPTN